MKHLTSNAVYSLLQIFNLESGHYRITIPQVCHFDSLHDYLSYMYKSKIQNRYELDQP